MPIWETVRKAKRRAAANRRTKAAMRATRCVRASSANQLSLTTMRKARSVVSSKRCATGTPLRLVGIEQARTRTALHDECELPAEVVGILQTRVHALCSHGAVDVRGVAEQEAAPVAEARRRA